MFRVVGLERDRGSKPYQKPYQKLYQKPYQKPYSGARVAFATGV